MRTVSIRNGSLWLRSIAMLGLLATMSWASSAFAGVEANTDATGVVIHGYDPVAYFTDGKPVAGEEQFSAEFGGGKYLFSTAANRDAFVANPSKYAPQYGGYCAFGVALGKKFDVDPASFKIVDGKLYLNLNPQVLKKWIADTADYLKKSEANWSKIQAKSPSEL